MRYIRPAALADAFRWEGQHSQEWPQWAKDKGSMCSILFVSGTALSVATSDGTRRVNRGDWVVHFDDGELAVFSHGKFQRTFKDAAPQSVVVPEIPIGGSLEETEPVARRILEDAGLRLADSH